MEFGSAAWVRNLLVVRGWSREELARQAEASLAMVELWEEVGARSATERQALRRAAGEGGEPMPKKGNRNREKGNPAMVETIPNNKLEKRLWAAADELRANSKLKASEYSVPVLGLIFLRYADHRFAAAEGQLAGQGSGRREIGPADYQALGVMDLPEEARFGRLLELPEGANLGQAINDAMRAIEGANRDFEDVLPKTYNRLDNATLVELLKLMASIPMDLEGDAFGKIYEYFLGKFAMSEGQKGGEFYTQRSVVGLTVRIAAPQEGMPLLAKEYLQPSGFDSNNLTLFG